MATKKKKSKEDNEAVENEEDVAMVDHDAEYQVPDQIMPQCDLMMMIPKGEQEQQQEVEQPLYVEYQEPQIVPQSLMMIQEGEQQQEHQQVTQSPLLPPQDPQGQDPGLWMDTVAQINNINMSDYDDFWNMSEGEWWNSSDDKWWNSSDDQFPNI